MKKHLLGLFLLLGMGAAHAGTGWYVTFVNKNDYPIYLSFGGQDHWHCNDFANNNTVPARGSITLYTEAVEQSAGICGLNVSGGAFDRAHIEVWQNDHPYSVTDNISQADNTGGSSAPTGSGAPARALLRAKAPQNHVTYNIGTNRSSITTSVKSLNKGIYDTVEATVTFD